MCLCMKCGFVTYPEMQQKAEDVTEFYREEYREAPSVNNLFSGERKLHYHGAFLQSVFEEWKKENKENPRVLEIGSAFGMFLQWFKTVVPGAEAYGTELTLSFRRNAWWLYGLRLDEKPDFSKKYDLIISYKVAEHIPNIDKELKQYAEALKDGGRLYISVPTWFGTLCNFGLGGFNLEYYYHKNHINVWSRNLFEQLLAKSGLKVIKFNDTYYDDTYLCERDDRLINESKYYDDPEKRLEQIATIFKAAKLFDVGEYEQARDLYKNFPDAHMNAFEKNRGKFHKEGFENIKINYLDRALQECPTSSFILNFVADLHMRYEKYPEALKYLEKYLENKPNDPQGLIAVGHCYRQLSIKAKEEKDKVHYRKEAREVMKFLQSVSKQTSFDAITWQMADNAELVAPFETNQKNEDAKPRLASTK